MLKHRIIPVQLLHNGRLVKTVEFGEERDVGNPITSSKVYNSQNADELIFLNIDREKRSVISMGTLLNNVSEVCFMPLSVGGGVNSVDDASFLIRNGADKVVINSSVYCHPDIISEIADRFGSQAVIIGIDVRKKNNEYILYSNCGQNKEELSLESHINKCIEMGAGEILIQSIDNDGAMQGFDVELISKVVEISSVPVIALGGSGNYEHLKAAFIEGKASAIACGSLFNFSDSNPIRAKSYLSNYGLNFKVA